MACFSRNGVGAVRVVAQLGGARSFSTSPVSHVTLRDLEGVS